MQSRKSRIARWSIRDPMDSRGVLVETVKETVVGVGRTVRSEQIGAGIVLLYINPTTDLTARYLWHHMHCPN
jgi:hypothetical protein